jgi:hypothetical protein
VNGHLKRAFLTESRGDLAMKDVFSKTRIPYIAQSMKESFPDKNIVSIYRDACAILENEIKCMDDRENRVVGGHLRQNVLPGYACYKALVNVGVSQEQAIDFVELEMCKAVERMAKLCRILSTKSFAFPVFKLAFTFGMKFGYPKEGWTTQMIENSKNKVRFNITACLYCEELEKRNALALCRAFCQTDHAAYDPLAPSVIFERKGTLATTGIKCDFCFRKGQI